MYSDRCCGSR